MPDTPKSPLNHFSAASNKVFRHAINVRKMIKRIASGKVLSCNVSLSRKWAALADYLCKEASNPFLKTVKIFWSETETMDAKMILDTGCEAHNLISYQVIDDMHETQNIILSAQPICICLNGENLVSMGTVILRWKGRGFRKIFQTTFHVIEDNGLPWQVILGAETIRRESILKFMGFGGRTILPKKTKGKKPYEVDFYVLT